MLPDLKTISEWQTLIAGILALIAAMWTAFLLNKQISTSETHEYLRRKSNETAARTVLPLTLSNLIDYLNQLSQLLHTIHRQRDGLNIPGNATVFDIPTVPKNIIESLQTIVAASTNFHVSSRVAEIVKALQIVIARMQSMQQSDNPNRITSVTTLHIESHVISCGIIYAYTISLFRYARFETESPETVTWNDVRRDVSMLGWYEGLYPEIFNHITLRENRSLLVDICIG